MNLMSYTKNHSPTVPWSPSHTVSVGPQKKRTSLMPVFHLDQKRTRWDTDISALFASRKFAWAWEWLDPFSLCVFRPSSGYGMRNSYWNAACSILTTNVVDIEVTFNYKPTPIVHSELLPTVLHWWNTAKRGKSTARSFGRSYISR